MKDQIKVVLFDVDGVVVDSEMFSLQYSKKFGINNEEMLPFFKGVFQDCIIGKADLKEEVKPWLKKWKWDKSAKDFLNFWFRSEHNIDDMLVDQVEKLRASGIRCYLATKQEKYRTKYMREEMGFDNIFDGIFSSSEIGYKKPDEKFFQKILDELGIQGEEALFFDDEIENVEGAKSLGIKGFLYTGFDEFKKELDKFLK